MESEQKRMEDTKTVCDCDVPAKKRRVSTDGINDHRATDENRSDETRYKELIRDFKIVKVLNQNAQVKTICLQGNCGGDDEHDAVLILEKTPFNEEFAKGIFSDETKVDLILHNDIYNSLKIFPPSSCNALKSTLIYPATAKHLDKYKFHPKVMLNETPDDYRSITVPYIESASFSMQWVYNILEKKTESERIVFEDPHPETGFILLPDIKWDGIELENLYLVAIVHNRGLRSIRDLRQKHLDLLVNIRDNGTLAIFNKYKVPKEKLRIFFHYQPSYYHLHIHFAHLDYDAPGLSAGKAHLLDDVIDNIRLDGDFYEKKTLTFYVNESVELAERFRNSGKLEEVETSKSA